MKCVGMRCYNSGSTIVSSNMIRPEFSNMMFKQKELLEDKNNNLRGNN
jgi:hypothetical protein